MRIVKEGAVRKQELVDIGLLYFISKGYSNTSMDLVMQSAGITKGAFYYYFKSKEDLLESLIDSMVSQMHSLVSGTETLSGFKAVNKIISDMVASISQENILFLLLFSTESNSILTFKLRKLLMKSIAPLLEELLKPMACKTAVEKKYLGDKCEFLLILIIGLLEQCGLYALGEIESKSIRRKAHYYEEFFKKELSHKKEYIKIKAPVLKIVQIIDAYKNAQQVA